MRDHLLPIIYAVVVCTAQHLLGVDAMLHRVGAVAATHEPADYDEEHN